ncbi:hypothetical protein [Sphingomonas baiyangensis]|uniref:Uncharacterized protein n=1 Tax=Sphingomonas baiyangensis TaxID=2572576 RepID=A0A4U1L402_9SPHN|nr:hypothetical protein [Sphingomonas baiyangensis]TKD51224.1 hypothetical protein FBR43_11015 [Sphingomonas baiyangensis]
MSTLGDAVKGIKQLLLLQEQVRQLEKVGEKQSEALGRLTGDVLGLDKRVIRIETMIEMTQRSAQTPRIEG